LAAAAGAGLTLASSGTLMPFVIGHRGIPKIYPENTLISFQAAIDAGVDGIESDLHLTKDNVIVLLHDDTLDRTTNCTGNVWDYNYADLASCNANYASVFGDKWSFQPIPTFESIVGASRALVFHSQPWLGTDAGSMHRRQLGSTRFSSRCRLFWRLDSGAATG
jgi:glycerophosphoryl diester phosphodiesterase